MANNEVTTGRFTKKDFRGVFWRSFTLLGSFNYERMEGLGFLYAIMPLLRKIYKDDDEGLKAAMHRNIAAFNMTVAPSPFVMGTTIAMEESAKEDPNFDVSTINAIKVSLMGPLSGIGDTFFWALSVSWHVHWLLDLQRKATRSHRLFCCWYSTFRMC